MDERGRELGGVAATHLIEASERVTRSTIESIGAGSSSFVSPPSSAAVLTASPAAARKGERPPAASGALPPCANRHARRVRLFQRAWSRRHRAAAFVTAAAGGGRGGLVRITRAAVLCRHHLRCRGGRGTLGAGDSERGRCVREQLVVERIDRLRARDAHASGVEPGAAGGGAIGEARRARRVRRRGARPPAADGARGARAARQLACRRERARELARRDLGEQHVELVVREPAPPRAELREDDVDLRLGARRVNDARIAEQACGPASARSRPTGRR